MAQTAGLSRPTITKAMVELDDEPLEAGRVRREGGGRRSATETDPGLEKALDALVDPDARGIRSRRCGGRSSPLASWRRR